MGSAKKIEEALLRLSPVELDAFREWFADFDGAAWDRQMEDDIAGGGGRSHRRPASWPLLRALRPRANPRFWDCYHQLSRDIQHRADESYELLRRDPKHPSLHFKKVGRIWSVRIGLHHRALAVEQENTMVWFWIGSTLRTTGSSAVASVARLLITPKPVATRCKASRLRKAKSWDRA